MTHERSSDPLIRRLDEIAAASPELRVTARLYQAVLPLVQRAEVKAAIALDARELGEVLQEGAPLLTVADVEVDVDAAAALLLAMLRAVQAAELPRGAWRIWDRSAPGWSEPDIAAFAALRGQAGTLAAAVDAGVVDAGEMLALAAAGDRDGFSQRVQQVTPGWELMWTLSHHALRPFLHEVCRQAPLEEVGVWEQGTCYVCGAGATLAELQDDDQVKHLRCAQCGADWHHPRLQCHHCGNEDRTTLRYLYVEGREHRRVEVCDACRGYLKVITSFTPTPPELLVVEDLATLELDFLAQQQGYRMPPPGDSGRQVAP
ncbi:formate dehydrogenase accessory protein FdhE [Geomonas propionica]|uniref:Formate dehydrogenase accessory protein FdhE n=1 Tax=Geomonas propionica TaxID=2798582 RepID=A0ABS0YW47_9BACT|nr:formate dehydrogenase accessory protein FdhE [Geomonas propionica]MBJ6802159.1 formate dehydrogenase accessory protein FdhE [Geomonas propionica]